MSHVTARLSKNPTYFCYRKNLTSQKSISSNFSFQTRQKYCRQGSHFKIGSYNCNRAQRRMLSNHSDKKSKNIWISFTFFTKSIEKYDFVCYNMIWWCKVGRRVQKSPFCYLQSTSIDTWKRYQNLNLRTDIRCMSKIAEEKI